MPDPPHQAGRVAADDEARRSFIAQTGAKGVPRMADGIAEIPHHPIMDTVVDHDTFSSHCHVRARTGTGGSKRA